MLSSRTKLRTAAAVVTAAAALAGFGAGTANAAGWPAPQEGAFLYSDTNGSGSVTKVDLNDFGTCHDLAQPARSIQIINGAASVVVYSGTDCTGSAWASGSFRQANLPVAELSYRVVAAS